MLAASDREADAVHRHLVAIAHDQVLHLDTRHAHASSLVTPRVSRNRITSATITVKVWISAIAAVSSVPRGGKGVDDRRRDHLGVGAHQEHRGAELAHAGHEDQQPRRQDAGLEQRQGDGAHLVDPAGAADAGAFLQALVDLQHDAGQGAHAERQHHGEIGERQQPQRAVDRDRDVEPGPQQRQAEDQARHGLREHHEILDGAAPDELRAVDDPDQDHHHQHADAGHAEAQHQAVAHGGAHRPQRQRGLVVGERELGLAQDHGGEALQRGEDAGPRSAARRPAGRRAAQTLNSTQASRPMSIGRGLKALPVMVAKLPRAIDPAIEGQHGEHDDEQRQPHRRGAAVVRRIGRASNPRSPW